MAKGSLININLRCSWSVQSSNLINIKETILPHSRISKLTSGRDGAPLPPLLSLHERLCHLHVRTFVSRDPERHNNNSGS